MEILIITERKHFDKQTPDKQKVAESELPQSHGTVPKVGLTWDPVTEIGFATKADFGGVFRQRQNASPVSFSLIFLLLLLLLTTKYTTKQ